LWFRDFSVTQLQKIAKSQNPWHPAGAAGAIFSIEFPAAFAHAGQSVPAKLCHLNGLWTF